MLVMMQRNNHFYFAGGIKHRTGNLENNLAVSYKTKRATTKWHISCTLGHLSQEMKTYVYTKSSTWLFIAASFVITPAGHNRCIQWKWLKMLLHLCHGILLSNKKNEPLIRTETSTELQEIMLSQKSQSSKGTHYRFHLYYTVFCLVLFSLVFIFAVMRIEPRALCKPGKYFYHWVKSQILPYILKWQNYRNGALISESQGSGVWGGQRCLWLQKSHLRDPCGDELVLQPDCINVDALFVISFYIFPHEPSQANLIAWKKMKIWIKENPYLLEKQLTHTWSIQFSAFQYILSWISLQYFHHPKEKLVPNIGHFPLPAPPPQHSVGNC